MARIVTFAGPCLYGLGGKREDVLAGLDLRPPARRGDIVSAVAENPGTIVLLDGYFFGELSVTHKELLYALEAGVRVIGAASLGALRALEMAPFGMVGIGEVYQLFASGRLDGDDEVALLHLPETEDFRPITIALVEVRAALDSLLEDGVCGREGARAVVAGLKRMAFSRRSPKRLRDLADQHLPGAAKTLEKTLERLRTKQHDALAAIEAAKAGGRIRQPPRRRPTIFMTYWCEDHLRVPKAVTGLPHGPTLFAAWNAVQLLHPRAPARVALLRRRFLAASAADRAGVQADPDRVAQLTGILTSVHEERWGGLLLPAREVAEEARAQALGEAACVAFGGDEGAAKWLAVELSLDGPDGPIRLRRHLARQFGLQPAWHLARSFTFCSSLDRALELAESVDEIFSCYQAWAEGARIARSDLAEVAATIWNCGPEAIAEEARRRGLLEARSFSQGLGEVLQRLAPAERLPRPINDYLDRKRALVSAILDYPVELLPAAEYEAQPRISARRRMRRFGMPLVRR